MANQLAQYGFPDAYSTLVAGYTGTVVYVSSTGSNSNNGSSATSPYLTVDYAITNNTAISRLMIVVLAGTYTMTAVSGTSSGSSVAIRDGGNERVYVCCPSQTIIQWTASTGDRDCSMVDFANTASAIYGGILKRNNNGRSGNYVVAFYKGATKGNFYNCVFSETNANGSWSYQYDNYGGNNLALRNCTFYNASAPSGNYTNAGTCLTIDSVFNTTITTGGTETNVLKSQTVSGTTYVTTGVTTAGVYSGTYAWNGVLTLGALVAYSNATFATAVSAVNEGTSPAFQYSTSTTSTFTINYTITGTNITTNDIGIPLTGSMTVTNTSGFISVPILADNTLEGTEVMYVTVGPFTTALTIYDTSAPLTVIPPTGAAGTQYVITINTTTANGTAFNYNITGTNITTATVGSIITGTFIINNNTASITLFSGSVAGSTFYVNVPDLGLKQSGVITFTSSTSFTTATITLQMTSTATLMQSNGSFPIAGLSLGQLNSLSLPSTSTYTLTGQNPIPGLSLFQINYQSTTTTSTYLITKQNAIPAIMQGSTQPVAPPQQKITSQADTGYGNTPVTPLGQPLVKEFWL